MKKIDIDEFKRQHLSYLKKQYLKDYVFFNVPEMFYLIDNGSDKETELVYRGLFTGDLKDCMKYAFDEWCKLNGLEVLRYS